MSTRQPHPDPAVCELIAQARADALAPVLKLADEWETSARFASDRDIFAGMARLHAASLRHRCGEA